MAPKPPAAALLAVLALLGPQIARAEPATSAPAEPEAQVLANTGSKRIPFAAREWLEVGLDVNGVRVERIRLRPIGKFRGLFTKNEQANRGSIAVKNDTDRRICPNVAVAVLDAEGRLLAAANTGNCANGMEPGTSREMDIHFGGVFRYIERGDYILLSVEY